MKKLLVHSKTKGELTTFLAKNVKDNAKGRQVVVAWGMAALPAFHALTGAYVTGSFSGKGKATCWDEFDNASTPILQDPYLLLLDWRNTPTEGNELTPHLLSGYLVGEWKLSFPPLTIY